MEFAAHSLEHGAVWLAYDPRLAEFVEAYAGGGQGGEKGAPCRGGGVTPRETRGQLGTAA